MNYFRLYNSAEPEVGFVPQVHDSIANFDINHPNSANNINLTYANESTLWPIPKLSGKAKKTDLISTSSSGLSGKLLISPKLYNIVSNSSKEGIQFIKTELIIKKGKTEDFWIVNPFLSDLSFIDCAASRFGYMDSMGYKVLEEVQFFSTKSIVDAYKENQISAIKNPYPNHRPLTISKIVINENCGLDFFSAAPLIFGGIGYFVSEKIKNEIEDVGCTGIVFTKPNEKYPSPKSLEA